MQSVDCCHLIASVFFLHVVSVCLPCFLIHVNVFKKLISSYVWQDATVFSIFHLKCFHKLPMISSYCMYRCNLCSVGRRSMKLRTLMFFFIMIFGWFSILYKNTLGITFHTHAHIYMSTHTTYVAFLWLYF